MIRALRWEVLEGLGKTRQRVARGDPSLHTALYYVKLSQRAWVEVDKSLDDVRFTVPAAELEQVAQSRGTDNPDGRGLQEHLAACWRNRHLPWESPEGHSRAQCVALLFIAREFIKRLPVTSAGPLLPSLGLSRPEEVSTQPAAPEGEDTHG